MSEPDSPLDAALDVFVYAPVGLALNAAEEIPKLAAKGRAQLSMARVVGRFAVAQARQQLIERVTSSVMGGTAPSAGQTTADRPPPSDNAGTAPRPPRSEPSPQGEGDRPESASSAVPAVEPLPVPPGTAAEPATSWPAAAQPAPVSAGQPAPVSAGQPAPGWRVGETADAEGQPDDPSGLAIPGYDSLAASQVVPRLAGLSVDELTAVEAYETAHRGRRTILTRVRQLQER